MSSQDEPRKVADTAPRERTESDERTRTSAEASPRTDRDKRWKAAQAGHWHNAGYSSETQARSDTEDRT